MKSAVVVSLVVLACAVPRSASASLELGTTSVIAVNAESERASIGVGLGVEWRVFRDIFFGIPGDTFSYYSSADVTLFVLKPAATLRLYVTSGEDVQPFIVTRIERHVPIASSKVSVLADDYEDYYDAWRLGLGGGIRSRLSHRFAVGGEVVARTTLRSYGVRRTDVDGGTDFLVYVQYHP